MSILFTLKGELDRRLYWIQMRQEALRFISGYRRNNIIDISFPEKGFNRWSGQGPFVSRLPLPLIVGAVVCKLRGFEAKRQQMNNILHRQRSSLFQGSIFSEPLLRNPNGKINWDFQCNQYSPNRWQNSRRITRNCTSRRIYKRNNRSQWNSRLRNFR